SIQKRSPVQQQQLPLANLLRRALPAQPSKNVAKKRRPPQLQLNLLPLHLRVQPSNNVPKKWRRRLLQRNLPPLRLRVRPSRNVLKKQRERPRPNLRVRRSVHGFHLRRRLLHLRLHRWRQVPRRARLKQHRRQPQLLSLPVQSLLGADQAWYGSTRKRVFTTNKAQDGTAKPSMGNT